MHNSGSMAVCGLEPDPLISNPEPYPLSHDSIMCDMIFMKMLSGEQVYEITKFLNDFECLNVVDVHFQNE